MSAAQIGEHEGPSLMRGVGEGANRSMHSLMTAWAGGEYAVGGCSRPGAAVSVVWV